MYIYSSSIKRNNIKIPSHTIKHLNNLYEYEDNLTYGIIYHIPDVEFEDALDVIDGYNLRWVELPDRPEWYYFDLLPEYNNAEYAKLVNNLALKAVNYLANWNGITPEKQPRKTKAGGYISITATYPVQTWIPDTDDTWFGSSRWFKEYPDGINEHAVYNCEHAGDLLGINNSEDVISALSDSILDGWNDLYLDECSKLGINPRMEMDSRVTANMLPAKDLEIKIWILTYPKISSSDARVGIGLDWKR